MPIRFEDIHIYTRWCKSCGICIEFCPKGVLACDDNGIPIVVHPDDCTNCGLCEIICPDFAITGMSNPSKAKKRGK